MYVKYHQEEPILPLDEPETGNGFKSYVGAFKDGVGDALSDTWEFLKDPWGAIKNTAQTIGDGYMAIGDVLFGLSTDAARQRNSLRGAAVLDGADEFVKGDGVTRARMLTHVATNAVIGLGVGAAETELLSVVKNTEGFIKGVSGVTSNKSALRLRVEGNIAESKAARGASRYRNYVEAEGKVSNKGLARTEIIQESNSRTEYLRSKYGSMSSQERLAKIDSLAGENYTRRLFEAIDQGDGVVFRYLSEQGLKKSLETGTLRGYTTTKFSSSSSEVAKGAQIFPEWGIPKYGAAIPVNKLSGFKLARPMGNSTEFGWELFTNSYPKAGAGHWSQFLIDKVEIENVYIFRLNK